MTVKELIQELQHYPKDMIVKMNVTIEMTNDPLAGYEITRTIPITGIHTNAQLWLCGTSKPF